MLGFSVYLGQPLNTSYILDMVHLGYDVIFTSLQIPEENDETKLTYLGELCQLLKDTSVTYIIDINPSLLNQNVYRFFDQFPNGDFVIRIDEDFKRSLIEDLYQHHLKCCLNASTITAHTLDTLYNQKSLPKIYFCHNYYPRPDTGLALSFIEQQNELIRKYDEHAPIMAFIPGTTFRGPIFKGLPTIEQHRHMTLLQSAQALVDSRLNYILIGDTAITRSEAIALQQMIDHRHFKLRLTYFDESYEQLIFKHHTSRLDAPEHVIRSKYSRSTKVNIPPNNHSNHNRTRGDITVDNSLNKRYEGELQIIKSDLPSHKAINHVASICAEDIAIIDLIQPGDTFEFITEKEKR
ncbi:MupG family TIM beta-alpha barrel fold protein [Staphylococcus sp. GDY8P85P]|uniref:MupG family TIM beta-alpha barrel fold protein n=1 Tax=Staphylococcus sp. GDY8P85P TaxID=2804138 RepID=UPI001AEBC7D8|nr:MupG family TIM beta-alpha barrel fold protein [Staphylococcus sp. GDY8P85P]